MVRLILAAVELILQSCGEATHGLSHANFKSITIKSVTVDSSQRSTLQTAVLAIPPDHGEWCAFLCDPKRLVTILSGSFRTTALPRLMGATSKARQFTNEAQRLLKDFSAAGMEYRYSRMQELLGQRDNGWNLWEAWMQQAAYLLPTHRAAASAHTASIL